MIGLLATLLLSMTTGASAKSYAIVVANSRSLNPEIKPLEYADEDGARWAELFDGVADGVELLTVLDPEAQQIYPDLAKRAGEPNRAGLDAALARTFEKIAHDVKRGERVTFYFVMVGHGELGPGGEGFVSLLDAPFTRTDLYRRVIARSPATTNHVIIDACNSYFLVNKRGGTDDTGPSRAELLKQYMSQEELAQHPNTGVLLSTSSAKESHEWSGYRAGVFSHELRSALLGAADANGDGVIEYSEVHGFIAAANLRVEDPRARVEMYAVPPAIDVRAPIVELASAHFAAWISIPAGAPLRLYIEDERGVRSADVHLTGEVPTYVALLSKRRHFVRTLEGMELRIDPATNEVSTLELGQLRPIAMASRGAIGDVFEKKLFAEAFGPSFLRGFAAANGYALKEPPLHRWTPGGRAEVVAPDRPAPILAYTLLAGGVALAGGAVATGLRSKSIEDDFESHIRGNMVRDLTREQAAAMETSAKNWAWARDGLILGSAGALVAGAALLLFDGGDAPHATPLVSATYDRVSFELQGRF